LTVLSRLIESWVSLYANHAALRTGIEFLRIGGLAAGGGCAITTDLATITAARDRSAARTTQLHLLKQTHLIVVLGLVALAMSGLLLFGADVQTFLYSRIFWLKMGLMVLLLINGLLLLRGERQVRRGEPHTWARLHYTAVASLVLWALTTLAGAALPNIG
jgi:F0F1-type ATP synthase membrane subunit c/vacuolar-type H+-ATPase subunit K